MLYLMCELEIYFIYSFITFIALYIILIECYRKKCVVHQAEADNESFLAWKIFFTSVQTTIR